MLCARSKALYFEGCNAAKLLAPALHAAVVEVVIGARATAKYATLQN